MIRKLVTASLAAAALVGATAAHAGTHWSIGINVPLAGIVVSDGRYVEPAPVYYTPPPVVYAPAPRYVEREVYYAPPPPPRVIYETTYREGRWDDRRWDDRRWEHERHEHRDHWDRDDGPRRGR
ncbi:hypothetical protein ACG04R_23065 [Roseateles sp. BYS78W]|uniref:Uncharacterized protein n=1 Tax=Pelomonas candidula TaxID=3299025 RepID=A0ABW7HI68_9BURK